MPPCARQTRHPVRHLGRSRGRPARRRRAGALADLDGPPSPLFPYATLFRSGQPGIFATLDAGAPRTLGLYFMYDVKQADPAEWTSPPWAAAQGGEVRSEEHTSELQSHSDLACRLAPDKQDTRYGISVDPADGLLAEGELVLSRTSMDRRLHSFPTRRSSDLASPESSPRSTRAHRARWASISCTTSSRPIPPNGPRLPGPRRREARSDRKSTRLNSSHTVTSHAALRPTNKTPGTASRSIPRTACSPKASWCSRGPRWTAVSTLSLRDALPIWPARNLRHARRGRTAHAGPLFHVRRQAGRSRRMDLASLGRGAGRRGQIGRAHV